MEPKSSKNAGTSTTKKPSHASDELVEPCTANSNPDDNHFSQLTNEWLIKNQVNTKMNYPDIVEQAAAGLEKEGILIGRVEEGTELAKMLRKVKYSEKKEIILSCINMYTMECFLYKVLNKALREFDTSKVDTLGPYCYFLNCYPEALGRDYFVGTVYRGIDLDSKNIEIYKKAVGQWKSWPAFTTTQKRRDIAEQSGNVLFVIELTSSTRYGKAIDISHASYYTQEQEVLLLPGSNFRINKMEYLTPEKPVFYLTIV